MEASPTSLRRLRFGKLKVVRRRLLQRYEHQPFISCLAGFYSCRWRRYQRERTEPGKCCCSMVSELKGSTDLDFCTGTGHSMLTRGWCCGIPAQYDLEPTGMCWAVKFCCNCLMNCYFCGRLNLSVPLHS